MTITKLAITVNDTKKETYDGTEKTLTIAASKASGVLDGETLTLTGATITGTNASTYTDVAAYTWSVVTADGTTDSTDNYTIEVTGTLTIDKAKLTITANSDSKKYDGSALTNSGWKDTPPTGMQGDDAVDSVKVTGSQTLVGKSANVPSNAVVKSAARGDVTANYNITYVNGTLEVTDGTPDDPVDPPAVGSKTHEDKEYKLGEVITWNIEVKNIYDAPKTITLEEKNGIALAQSVFENVPAGGTIKTTATKTVTEDDILAGEITNTVKVIFDEGITTEIPSTPVEPEDLNTTLTVDKQVTNKPANGTAFALGETIEYSITVTNDGNVAYTGIEVSDDLTGKSWTIDSLAVGKSQTFTTSYKVTEADILAGSVANTATAAGDPIDDPKDPDNPKTPEGEDTVTTGDNDDPHGPVPPVEKANPSLNVDKSPTNTPANGSTYGVGETITYSIVITNNGNVTLTGINVSDTMSNITGTQPTLSPATITSLAPGASQTYTVS